MKTYTNYTIRLTDKKGDVSHHDFFVGSVKQARDYAYLYAVRHAIVWPGPRNKLPYYELFAKVTP